MKKIKKIIKASIVLFKYYYYLSYCKINHIKNDDVWLISERGNDARDNSYWLFKYIRENHPDIKIKYVIDEKSSDFKKIKALGDHVQFGSKEHYILLITSGYLISTHIMGYTPDMSLFCRMDRRNMKLFSGKRIFIQHGLIKDKMTEKPNFDLMTSGAKVEYDNLIKMMPEVKNKIKFTGLARFDNLPHKHTQSKKILLMPTFRKWTNYYSDEQFMQTDYYKCLQDIISGEDIKAILKEYDYELIFYPHIEAQKRLHLFSPMKKYVTIASFDKYDVQNLLIECDLLITDYSSVFFDYGYMQKPIIYYQFDRNEYFSKHYEKGYFDYTRDGFGQVVESKEAFISLLKKILKNGCKNDEKYIQMTKKFFGVIDDKNCERIYKEIINTK